MVDRVETEAEMTPEYTAEQQRADEWNRDLRRICRILWDAACDHDPALRDYQRGDLTRHGTRWAYDAHGCRCVRCREFARNDRRGRRTRAAARAA